MTHRFIVLVDNEDAEKLNRWASATTLAITGGFPIIEDSIAVLGVIDNGEEPTPKTLDSAVAALAEYDADLAEMFRQELQTGNVDRAGVLRAVKQFTRTRKHTIAKAAAFAEVGKHRRGFDCNYPVVEE